jgi:tetratricopeptide (TPR) repeat protein
VGNVGETVVAAWDPLLEAEALLGACRAHEAMELLADAPPGEERDRLIALARFATGAPMARRTTPTDSVDPDEAWVHAWSLAAEGATTSARELATSAARRAPDRPGLAVFAAGLELEHGSMEVARELLDDALAARPDDARLLRAAASLGLPDAGTAAGVYRAALDEDPLDPLGWLGLGEAHHRAGDLQEAVRAWSRGLRQRPSDPHLQRRLRDNLVRTRGPLYAAAGDLLPVLAGAATFLLVGMLVTVFTSGLGTETRMGLAVLGLAGAWLVYDRVQDRHVAWLRELRPEVQAAVAGRASEGVTTTTTTTRVYLVIAAVVLFGPTLIHVPLAVAQGREVPAWQWVWFVAAVCVAATVAGRVVVGHRRARRLVELRLLRDLLGSA